MEIAYWAARWKEGRIGFHEGRTNTFLERHVAVLGAPPRRVLVPLCGKAEDLAFLAAQGHRVVGIEAVEDAVKAFFDEHDLSPTIVEHGERVRAYSSGAITILAADLFDCTPEHVGEVDAFYDRAALVALPVSERRRYVAHIRHLSKPGSRGLVVTFEYEKGALEPPPHPIGADELRELYGGALGQLDEGPLDGPRFREAGVIGVERCFSIEL